MDIKRKERIQVAIEILRSVHFDEAADGLSASDKGADPEIISQFYTNAEYIDEAIADLEQVR